MFKIKNCPKCKQPPAATLEKVWGRAELRPSGVEGTVDYSGETEIDWNSQETVLDRSRATMRCSGVEGHVYKARMERV